MVTARVLRFIAARPPFHGNNLQARRRALSASTASTTEAAGAGDPALHSGDAPSEEYTERPPRFSAAASSSTAGKGNNNKQPSSSPNGSEDTEARVPPFGSSSGNNLSSQELGNPAAGSSFTQKRRFSEPAAAGRDARDEATPGREESAARKVREEDREYYRTHKPSPLAEIEFADTRKPVTQATDGGAADRLSADVAVGTSTVEDTADDSLARAEAMFREAASRGNPDWPQSRVLAEMLARRRQENKGAPWSS